MQYPTLLRRLFSFLVAVVPLLATASPLLAAGAPETAARQTPTVTVVGQGELVAQPDQATINLGVQLYSENAQDAAAELQDRMSAVIAAIRDLGVPESRIRTTNYSIFFERNYQAPMEPRSPGGSPAGMYRVENMVRVVIDDVDGAATIVGAAIEAGANQMHGISFSFSDPGPLEARARTLAIEDARDRAEALAAASGTSVGEVIEITEIVGGSPGLMEARSFASDAGAGPVEPGSARYTARVQVTYRIE